MIDLMELADTDDGDTLKTGYVSELLRPTISIDDLVKAILVNEDSTKVAVVCESSIIVVKLPQKCGSEGLFLAGMLDITCSSFAVESILHGDMGRVCWLHNYLLVMYHNHLQVHDTCQKGGTMVHFWPADNVVDFALVHPVKNEKYYKPDALNRRIILLLRDSGDIYAVNIYTDVNGLIAHHVSMDYEGLLPMYPPPEDNYGVESFSILALEGSPTVIVVASRTGAINHFLFLPDFTDEAINGPTCFSMPKVIHALFALDSPELDLGGMKFDSVIMEDDSDDDYMSSILLVPDTTSTMRYFALHKAGLHCLTLPDIGNFVDYLKKGRRLATNESQLHSKLPLIQCTVDYIVVTKCNINYKAHAPVGIVCIDMPSPLLIIYSHNSIKSTYFRYWSKQIEMKETKTELFSTINRVESILSQMTSIPFIELNGYDCIKPTRCLELFCRVSEHFKQDVFPRHEKCAEIMESRLQNLVKVQERQTTRINELTTVKKELQSKAEHLAEKYEESNEAQTKLLKRLFNSVIAINTLDSSDNSSDKQMAKKLNSYKERLEHLMQRFMHLSSKVELYKSLVLKESKDAAYSLDRSMNVSTTNSQVFSPGHLRLMHGSIKKVSEDLAENVELIKETERNLNLK